MSVEVERTSVTGFRITATIGIGLVHFVGWSAAEYRAAGMTLEDHTPDCAALRDSPEGYRWSWAAAPGG